MWPGPWAVSKGPGADSLRESLILVSIANVIACPVGYFLMNRLLRSYAYRTSLLFWIFSGAGIVTYLLALLSVSYQAFKAARATSTNALKYE